MRAMELDVKLDNTLMIPFELRKAYQVLENKGKGIY